MEKFKKTLLLTKKVSVWGIGYLGYTTLLRLQSKGFGANVFDFSKNRIDEVGLKTYPNTAQKVSWTKRGEIPELDLENINLTKNENELFDSNVHIISIPFSIESDSNFKDVIDALLLNSDKLKDSLIVFQSAGIPGTIEKSLKKLIENSVSVCTAFRDDWNLEDFFTESKERIISASDNIAKEKLEFFLKSFDLRTIFVNSIKEAEVLSNAKMALSTTINGFLNQLSFAYPDTNLKDLSSLILKEISQEDINISIAGNRFKEINASSNLIIGSKKDDILGILKEASNSNLSLLLHYGDLFIKNRFKSVSIYGVSSEGDIKDIRFSPTLMLAEYLHKNGVEVSINDPFFSNDELEKIIPYSNIFDLNQKNRSEVIIFMANHREYKYLTQKDLDRLNISNVQMIVDNTKIFKDFSFSKDTLYHIVGDGKLSELEL